MPGSRFAVWISLVACSLVGLSCSTDERFEIVLDELDGALLSVWGTSPQDVWAVGADAGDGPLVLQYDGTQWTQHDTGATGDLWWVAGRGDNIWMSGEDGLIVRYRRTSNTFETMSVPGEPTLFGIFPVADDDVWAVGGDLEDGVGVVHRWDGSAWSEVSEVPANALEDPLFKVWGRSSQDLWIVGLGSVALHRTATGWNTVEVPTGRRLLTVHGNADELVAVGGFASGLIVQSTDGTTLEEVTPEGALQLNGVWVEPTGNAIAVGNAGSIYERIDGEWEEVLATPITHLDYHAGFTDSDGGVWVVGGEIATEPLVMGRLVHRGSPVSSTIVGL